MSALTSLLVRDQVVSVRKIEEAIQRQVVSGGDLESALLEMNVVRENVLSAYRAAIFSLLSATREEVMKAPREIVKLVPRDVAEEYGLVPLAAEGQRLLVAVTEPLQAHLGEQLGFLLGHELVYRIVTPVRLAAALAHHYQIEPTPRMRRLAEKLRSRTPGNVPYVAPIDGQEVQSDVPHLGGQESERSTKKFGIPQNVARHRSSAPPPPSGSPPKEHAAQTAGMSSAGVGVARVVGVGGSTTARQTARPPPMRRSHPGKERRDIAPSLARMLHGPLPAKTAAGALEQAQGRDEILEVFFVFGRQFFDYTAVFVVHGDIAEGRDVFGDRAGSHQIENIAVPLDVPGVFADVRARCQPRIIDLNKGELDKRVARDLRREAAQPALLIPVGIRKKAVLVLYGDRSGDPISISDVPELLAFVPRVSAALERLIVRRKQEAREGTAVGPRTPSEVPSEPPRPPISAHAVSPASRKPTVQSVVPPKQVPPPAEIGTLPHGIATTPEPETRLSPVPSAGSYRLSEPPSGEIQVEATALLGDDVLASSPEAAALAAAVRTGIGSDAPSVEDTAAEGWREPGAEAVPDAVPKAQDGRWLEGPLGVLGVPRSAPPPPPRAPAQSAGNMGPMAGAGFVREPVMTRPDGIAPDHVARAREAVAALEAQHADMDLDDIPVDLEENDSGWAIEKREPGPAGSGAYNMQDAGRDVVSQRAGITPAPWASESNAGLPESAVVQPGGQTPAAAPTEALSDRAPSVDEPSVIVDMGEAAEVAVDELMRSSPEDDEEAVWSVLQAGESVLPVLVRRFPGPLWFDRSQPHRRLPRGRDLSAIARALVAFRDEAAPYVASLLDVRDTDRRFYATLLASEFHTLDLVHPLTRRIFDMDQGIRDLAVDVLRPYLKHRKEMEEVLKPVRVEARVERRNPQRRLVATRALGVLRDGRSAELLVDLLESGDGDLIDAAYRALVLITRQDFGPGARKWRQWLERHGSQHRVEWLIDGLVHSDQTIREASSAELKELTQQYYGYHHALPRRDREVARGKYRDWWESEGRTAF